MDYISIILTTTGFFASALISVGTANNTNSTISMATEVIQTTTQPAPVSDYQPLYAACYGKKIEASCPKGEKITVFEIHAYAKPLSSGCHLDTKSHRSSCCKYDPSDCGLHYTGSNRATILKHCNGRSACLATPVPWMALDNQYCKPELFPRFTTYITIHYGCIPAADGNKTIPTKITSGVSIITGNPTVLLGLEIVWLFWRTLQV